MKKKEMGDESEEMIEEKETLYKDKGPPKTTKM